LALTAEEQRALERFAGEDARRPAPKPPSLLYDRVTVLVVLGLVVVIGALIIALGLLVAAESEPKPPVEKNVGPFEFLVSTEMPPTQILVAAGLVLLAVALAAVVFEGLDALLTVSTRRQLLGTYRSAGPNRPPGEQLKLTVLVPAHNEEASLPETLRTLREQTRKPDRVIVVADNCTDGTVAIARESGVEVYETVNNTLKKGGALNQVLARILPRTGSRDVVMVMDADTTLDPQFLEVGVGRLSDDPALTAVGGIFYGEDGHGLIGQMQRNEYNRYSRQLKSRHGRVFVLTGTASIFRADALLDVAAARGVFIPGETGRVYDTAALTEDNELTLALRSLGGSMTSPPECRDTTELMPKWRNLWIQRTRWMRGALENLAAYGFTRATLRYWGQQVGLGYGAVALYLFFILLIITVLSVDSWIWFPFWMIVGAVFVVERVATVWADGWRAWLVAIFIIPELIYQAFLQAVFIKCLFDIALGRSSSWGHVDHSGAGSSEP
jgi:biofilm PGA synthesis N-glycosyltransferase PgaC